MLSKMEDYSEYIIQGEPDKRERVRNWMTAIGCRTLNIHYDAKRAFDTP